MLNLTIPLQDDSLSSNLVTVRKLELVFSLATHRYIYIYKHLLHTIRHLQHREVHNWNHNPPRTPSLSYVFPSHLVCTNGFIIWRFGLRSIRMPLHALCSIRPSQWGTFFWLAHVSVPPPLPRQAPHSTPRWYKQHSLLCKKHTWKWIWPLRRLLFPFNGISCFANESESCAEKQCDFSHVAIVEEITRCSSLASPESSSGLICKSVAGFHGHTFLKRCAQGLIIFSCVFL